MEIRQFDLGPLEGAPGAALVELVPGTTPEHVSVHVVRLDAGASLPRHPAGREQYFAVLSGHGRVAGDDDVLHAVGPGSLVVWSPGEQHTTWADAEMTAVIVQRRPA